MPAPRERALLMPMQTLPATLTDGARVCIGVMLKSLQRGYDGLWVFGAHDEAHALVIPELVEHGLVTATRDYRFPDSVNVRLTARARTLARPLAAI
jgi:hypothetical protein